MNVLLDLKSFQGQVSNRDGPNFTEAFAEDVSWDLKMCPY